MADKKISELVSITGSATAADDYFVVVDTSGAVTHKISREELNNAIEQDVLENISITNLTSDLNTNGNDINFGDNDKAIFGAGSDLQIYHGGSASDIKETGTGNLRIWGDDIQFFNSAGSKYHTQMITDGAVTLYYNGSEKLATTVTGCDIAGLLNTTNGITITNGSVQTRSDNYVYSSAGGASGNVKSGLKLEGTTNTLEFYTNNAERMRVNSDGSVVINNSGGDAQLYLGGSSGTNRMYLARTGADSLLWNVSNGNMRFGTNNAEAMRLTGTGRWWVGQAIGTTLGGNGGEAVTGIMHYSTSANAYTVIQSNGGNAPLYVAKGPNATGNGFIYFGQNGTNIGVIGNAGGRIYLADNNQNMGISFFASCLLPTNINGSAVDNFYDCGHPAYRWNDIRAGNAAIQTSDANEKQQIAALNDVEMTAAKAISQLFKTYKWNSAVEAKGDAARTHAGVIAQDVQAAMTAAGLDAGDYAFFISDTWWETQTEVPAVEAVEAVDAVYEDVVIPAVEEELDEDGTVIVEAQPERTEQRLVSEAIQAVEAVAAYTRTDTYDTAEEAPEGATERTRLGIRYPELLAFVGAATEQRLANIETRLTALEA
jgi:hypothetical protein